MVGEALRAQGILTHWNDARGFGFITPDGGGARTFVHISEFGVGSYRPRVGDQIRYREVAGRDGRPTATGARRVSSTGGTAVVRPAGRRARVPVFDIAIAIAFVVGFLWIDSRWPLPVWVPALYLGTSALTFTLYALDKRAAARRRRRISERTLLALGLVGGWPGAILAQQTLRHKTVKTSFRLAFWATVAVNAAAFVVVTTPLAASLMERLNGGGA